MQYLNGLLGTYRSSTEQCWTLSIEQPWWRHPSHVLSYCHTSMLLFYQSNCVSLCFPVIATYLSSCSSKYLYSIPRGSEGVIEYNAHGVELLVSPIKQTQQALKELQNKNSKKRTELSFLCFVVRTGAKVMSVFIVDDIPERLSRHWLNENSKMNEAFAEAVEHETLQDVSKIFTLKSVELKQIQSAVRLTAGPSQRAALTYERIRTKANRFETTRQQTHRPHDRCVSDEGIASNWSCSAL